MSTIDHARRAPRPPTPARGLAQLRPASVAYPRAFVALLQRDLHVLRQSTGRSSSLRTIMQPLLLDVRVHLRVPEDRPGRRRRRRRGGVHHARSWPASSAWPSSSRASRRWPCRSCRSSATPRRSRTGCWRRCRPGWSGVQKIVTGMLQGLIAAALVFPIAAVVPATPVHLHITLAGPAHAGAAGRLGGGGPRPRDRHQGAAAVRVVPVRPGGAAAHVPRAPSTTRGSRWRPIRWLQILVLVNPLVYMCEGFRAALTTGVPHMSLWAVYGALDRLRRRAHLDRRERPPAPRRELTSVI